MFTKIIRINRLYIIAIISLLIGALFLSYYSMNDTVEIFKKSTDSDNQISKVMNSENYAKTNSSSNKIKLANTKLADTEKEEILSEKALADTHYDSFGKKWMLCYLYIFVILLISAFRLYFKGWFIKVSQSRFQFFQVHFIQLKDGKKDALSYCHSL
jgi:hypothetical protein